MTHDRIFHDRLDRTRLGEQFDRRVKLMDKERGRMIEEYRSGAVSMRALAAKYGVSRSLVSYYVNPERYRSVKERVKRNWRKYHDRAVQTDAVRENRRYKKSLVESGKLSLSD